MNLDTAQLNLSDEYSQSSLLQNLIMENSQQIDLMLRELQEIEKELDYNDGQMHKTLL